ncbi:hypothetical protein BJX64DRAFT_297113 [Aspergillus heterothallicus]
MTVPHAASPRSTGITVIIVGLGIGGLTAAISCHLKGHQVIGFDKLENLEPFGDGLILTPNGSQVLKDLDDTGTIAAWIKSWEYTCRDCKIYDTNGVHVGQHPIPDTDKGLSLLPRGGLVQTLYQTAKRLGLDLRLGAKVTEFCEDETGASVDIGGERIRGDCIIFADGANSSGRAVVSSTNVRPYYSGFSVYRGRADGTALIQDSRCHWLLSPENKVDQATGFAGPEMYVQLATCGGGQASFCIGITRPEKNFWTTPIDKDEMLDKISYWKCIDRIRPVIEKMAKDQFILCPLLRAGILDSWVSPTGRIALIGDAAHPFFPTSAQGAAQAIEDAATLAITLTLAGKSNVKLGLQAMEAIRKHRATYIQRNAWRVNDAWFDSPVEERTGKKAAPAIGVIDWIAGHCCRTYASDQFDRVRHSLATGQPYVPTNIPFERKTCLLALSPSPIR